MQENKKEQNNLTGLEKIEVTPEDEASILGSLKAESASFVPDKLADVMKKAGVEAPVIEKEDEETILSSINKESSSFVPNDLLAIQKATGTVPLPSDQESLAIHEKVKNEGDLMVKEAEKEVFAKTGTRRRWSLSESFKSHKVTWISSLALGATAVAVAVGFIVTNGNKVTTTTMAYVSVSVQSASSYQKPVSGAYLAEAATTTTANTYTPSFSFVADSKNIAKASTLSADNYSASLVKAKISSLTSDIEAPSLIANKLLPPSYDLGYLETKDRTLKNNITVTIYSDSSAFSSQYEASYKSAINDYLTKNSIYADVNITALTDSTLNSYISDASSDNAQKILKAIGFLTNNGTDTANKEAFLKALSSEDSTVLDGLVNAFTAVASSPLSDQALVDVHDGIALAYYRYITGYTLTSTEKVADLQNELSRPENAYLLPWGRSAFSPDADRSLIDNSYYINANAEWENQASTYHNGLASHIMTQGDALSVYYHIRDLINASTKEKAEFVSLMNSIVQRVNGVGGNGGAFPDEHDHDHGGHDHGDWGGEPGGMF
jgi:hypothetical protein